MATHTKPEIEQSVRLFHALSDRTRLSILQRLRFGERCVCDLTDALDAAQSRLSLHLRLLKDALNVTTGTKSSCCGGSCGTGGDDPITSSLYSQAETAVLPAEAVLASLG